MKTPRITSAALVLALGSFAACAADAPGGGTGDGTGDGGGGGGGDDVQYLKLAGKYSLTSKFDIEANMPGKVGDIARTFIAMTDNQNDPGQWILETAIDALPNGIVKTTLNNAVPFFSGYINDRLLQIAPDFVTKIVKVGNVFGDACKNFGLVSQLQVAGTTNAYTATHLVDGFQFKIDGTDIPFMFAEYSMTNVKVDNLTLGLEQAGKLTVSEHKIPLQYGKVLRIALDAAIIPLVDPNASNVTQLLQGLVHCDLVGQAIGDRIGFGSGLVETACNKGLDLAAQKIYQQIADIDGSAFEFKVTGTAKAVDANGDHTADRIDRGAWAGDLSYAGTPAPLANAIFAGNKM
jgi:hypothetical protein